MLVVLPLSSTLALVDLVVVVMKVTVSVAIIYTVRSFCSNTYAGENFCSKYVGNNFD